MAVGQGVVLLWEGRGGREVGIGMRKGKNKGLCSCWTCSQAEFANALLFLYTMSYCAMNKHTTIPSDSGSGHWWTFCCWKVVKLVTCSAARTTALKCFIL